jgi:hypothetical protein
VKTRRFDAIMAEIEGFLRRRAEPSASGPGGVHLEFTGEDVTECLGGSEAVLEEQLSSAYMTLCDPRLNARQSLDLAFRLAELMRAPELEGSAPERLAVVGTGLIGAPSGWPRSERAWPESGAGTPTRSRSYWRRSVGL